MPSQLTVANSFQKAYDSTKSALEAAGGSRAEAWGMLLPRLKTLCDTTFAQTHAAALDDLRVAITKAKGLPGGAVGKFLLTASGLTDAAGGAAATDVQRLRVAALDLLQHTYFHTKKGAEALWIVSIPNDYATWPHLKFAGKTAKDIGDGLTASTAERFSADDRKNLAAAAQSGLAWTLKAAALVADMKAGSRGLECVRRWFGAAGTDDDNLRSFTTATLVPGLNKVAQKLNGGTAIVTDFVPIRNSADAQDAKARGSNAFVWAGVDTVQDVIYIEPAFFTRNDRNVFRTNAGHWSRIMVHEMTHRALATADHRYGYSGIAPGIDAAFTTDKARTNADSWAIFTADAAGAMSEAEIDRALTGR